MTIRLTSRPVVLDPRRGAGPDPEQSDVTAFTALTIIVARKGLRVEGQHPDEHVDPDPLVEPATVGADVTAIHRLEGVGADVLLAVQMAQPCDLDPDATWRSAFASQELEGAGPSERLNAAWCEVAVHPPDPAEGFAC